MNFKGRSDRDEPDINLIPMIDVLLVVLIFLMVSTTYVKRSSLQVDLPQGTAQEISPASEKIITIRVSADGQYAVDDKPDVMNEANLRAALTGLAQNFEPANPSSTNKPAIRVRIEADGNSSHQAVVSAMDAAASVGLTHVSIATARR